MPRHGARGRGVASQNFRVRMRRTNRPDFEHPRWLRDVIDVNRFAGDMFVRALVRRPIPRLASGMSIRRCFAGRRFRFIVCKKLSQQTRDQSLPISRAATHIGNGSEFAFENRQNTSAVRFQSFADQSRSVFRARSRHRRHAAEGEPRVHDRSGRRQIARQNSRRPC